MPTLAFGLSTNELQIKHDAHEAKTKADHEKSVTDSDAAVNAVIKDLHSIGERSRNRNL